MATRPDPDRPARPAGRHPARLRQRLRPHVVRVRAHRVPARAGAGVVRGPARPRHDGRAVEGGQAADDAERRGHGHRPAGARRLGGRRRDVLEGVPRGHGQRARAPRRRRRRATRRAGRRASGTGEAHVLLTINAQEKEDHQRALGKMRDAMDDAGGIRIVYQQDTALLKGAREHFGYADGFAQPASRARATPRRPGGGVPEKDGRWRALAPGEFVLGYPDEDTRDDPKRRLPNAPADPLGKSGTYMVWRKLYQDVALWRRGAARRREALPRRRRAQARGEGRRALARRDAARHAPRQARPELRPDRARRQRLSLLRRPRRHALPDRRAHPPLQPARRARLRGRADASATA